jgi:hypothetical protein
VRLVESPPDDDHRPDQINRFPDRPDTPPEGDSVSREPDGRSVKDSEGEGRGLQVEQVYLAHAAFDAECICDEGVVDADEIARVMAERVLGGDVDDAGFGEVDVARDFSLGVAVCDELSEGVAYGDFDEAVDGVERFTVGAWTPIKFFDGFSHLLPPECLALKNVGVAVVDCCQAPADAPFRCHESRAVGFGELLASGVERVPFGCCFESVGELSCADMEGCGLGWGGAELLGDVAGCGVELVTLGTFGREPDDRASEAPQVSCRIVLSPGGCADAKEDRARGA